MFLFTLKLLHYNKLECLPYDIFLPSVVFADQVVDYGRNWLLIN